MQTVPSFSINSTENKKQLQIYNILLGLVDLSKVSVQMENSTLRKIFIHHQQGYVPDFEFEWCSEKKHYRVYICVASRNKTKEKSGYCICTIGSKLNASGFNVLYQFLHKHRANNKEAA